MISALVKEARPKQWLKNVLVFAAPAALGDVSVALLGRALVVFVAFCLVASGTYYWNDIRDVEADRRHPRKRNRPVASGAVPLGVARTIGSVLLVSGILLAALVRPAAGGIVGLYAVLTLSYSMVLKHVAVVDLAIVASGFVLRAMAGAAGTDTRMSTWFVLCTSFGSFFIVTGKRHSELAALGPDAAGTRRSLAQYTLPFLGQVLGISCTATVVSYCLWAFENGESSSTYVPWHALSILPMVLALLRYLLLVERGEGESPEDVFTRDRPIQVFGLVWIVVYAAGVITA
jgi:decaprenyl-phosphate phosphoribosyltransferase